MYYIVILHRPIEAFISKEILIYSMKIRGCGDKVNVFNINDFNASLNDPKNVYENDNINNRNHLYNMTSHPIKFEH